MNEIIFDKLPVITEGERLEFYVEVGKMTQRKMVEYLKAVKNLFNKIKKDEAAAYFIECRNGVKSVDIKVEKT